MDEASTQISAPRKSKWKRNLIVVLVIIIVVLAAAVYFVTQNFLAVLQEQKAQQPIVQQHQELTEAIRDERARCENFISQGSGQFGEFQYCTQFLEWSQTILSSN